MTEQDVSHFRFSLLLKEIDNMRVQSGVSTVAMALIQLDGMEEINERFGYLGGDKVLKEFAVRLAGVTDANGRAFEITGTSFALLIANPLHEGDAVSGAEKIANVASEPVRIGTGKARVNARIGLSILPEPAATAEELLRQCELALAAARRHGETYRVFTPTLAENSEMNKSWFDVDAAVEQGEFELHYQPRIDLRTGTLVGAEALIRWQSPHAGTIPPSYFMPDITSTEGVRKMLRFVLRTSLADAGRWLERIPNFTLSVNMAPKNLTDPDMLVVVENALEESEFPAERLVLEVSEDILSGNEHKVQVQFAKLRARGIRVSIDDFGTGRSSMAALKALPIDQIKIDQAFVVPSPSNEVDRRIVGALVQLGHAFGFEVVAEGIEDADIMQTLLAIGCETGEGFHFSRPIPAAQFEAEWIDRFDRARSESA
ncbi:MAG: putative bifunctional diguanylate cyclase/phosphodiesterase [Gammaproteobacteria bacterium]